MIEPTYDQLVREGMSHNLADVLSSRQFPGVKGDTIVSDITPGQDVSHCDELYRQAGMRQGMNKTEVQNKKYHSSLADFPGDKKAWVDSRADITKVCRNEGWSCEGTVNVDSGYKLTDKPDRKAVRVGDDLVAYHAADHPEYHVKEKRKKILRETRERISGPGDDYSPARHEE